jgi:hypothetical protein
MNFPYGISDFEKVIREEYVYVDRTDRIPVIENAGSQLLFIRPRRFGKSLLLSMLENYYDLAKSDEFESLFGHLKIGKNPTPKHNKYFVMKWDFSRVEASGNVREIRNSLHQHIIVCIQNFVLKYGAFLRSEVHINPDDAISSFQSLTGMIHLSPYKLYLLIDEYDNFANEVLMGGTQRNKERYEDLLYGEGAVKTVFKSVKAASSGEGLDRVFITGVSPIVLSDMTSGYNVAENIYLRPEFNDLCGFHEAEIADILNRIVADCGLSEESASESLEMMRTFYNGYNFSYDTQGRIYNPTLALYFLKNFGRDCRYPKEILDSNLAMDRGKIKYISQLPKGERLIVRSLDETDPVSIDRLADRFGVEDILQEIQDESFMASFLYYFGVLTLAGSNDLGQLRLRIPNLVIRKLYVERIREILLPDSGYRSEAEHLVHIFYKEGCLQPLCDFIEQKYFKVFDNRDYRWSNELTVKTAFLTLLFNDTFYIMDSESVISRRYADLSMIIRPDMRKFKLLDHLIEFKYLSLTELNMTGEQAKQISPENLKTMPQVRQKLDDAKQQLAKYRQELDEKYKGILRLHTHAVVAVGFERVVWEEI